MCNTFELKMRITAQFCTFHLILCSIFDLFHFNKVMFLFSEYFNDRLQVEWVLCCCAVVHCYLALTIYGIFFCWMVVCFCAWNIFQKICAHKGNHRSSFYFVLFYLLWMHLTIIYVKESATKRKKRKEGKRTHREIKRKKENIVCVNETKSRARNTKDTG